jgi:hypothetical protein
MTEHGDEYSVDTRSLDVDPTQLSDNELVKIYHIEKRLKDAKKSDPLKPLQGRDVYLATTQKRHPRVLLLDGDRGTGKTSLLLTLVDRWRRVTEDEFAAKTARYEPAVGRLQSVDPGEEVDVVRKELRDAPRHVSVIDILDFDPLPRGMPIVAGIVQALRPIAEEYDRQKQLPEDCDEQETLLDSWHKLFRMAAVGWSSVPPGGGLVEQVLDREEQVKDWLKLGEKWQEFVSQLISQGQCLKGEHRLDEKAVLLIMVDDCDLQVSRISELLPALRLLYHPRLFFLVAGHKDHMLAMLKLDFLGRQTRLANAPPQRVPPDERPDDQWAEALSSASFEKVFPIRNRWRLERLSLAELLAFPRSQAATLETFLANWPYRPNRVGLAAYLKMMTQNEQEEMFRYWTYRTAQQLHQKVAEPSREEVNRSSSGATAADLLRHMLGANTDESQVIVKSTANDKTPYLVEYRSRGRVIAVFSPDFVDSSPTGDIVLSASAEFRIDRPEEAERKVDVLRKPSVPDLVAISLKEDRYGVETPRLQWDATLAIAWSRLDLPSHTMSFRWRPHRHPSPLRLLRWSAEWQGFLARIETESDYRQERIAYAWIWYQRAWAAKADSAEPLSPPDFFTLDFSESAALETFGKLVEQPPALYRDRWSTVTLPLLARPELGLPLVVQNACLAPLEKLKPKDREKWLVELRRLRFRAITDALEAAKLEGRARAPGWESSPPTITPEMIKMEIEALHRSMHNTSISPWERAIDRNAP